MSVQRPLSSSEPIWWTNVVLFPLVHIATLLGVYFWPPRIVNILLFLIIGQISALGIGIGYHRLFSHRAYEATLALQVVLAVLGAMSLQGSIKWWVLRHRLHHRYTDDPIHDPYSASRGFFFSHIGWLFYKPIYPRLESVERDDLDKNPVVYYQNKYFVPIATIFGFIIPTLVGMLWDNVYASMTWCALVPRVVVWHGTFLINSWAHWQGVQDFSDQNTSRTNLIFGALSNGEGNHNFHHAFPHDYRSGPRVSDWDSYKWIIFVLYQFGFVKSLRRARDSDIIEALAYMKLKKQHGAVPGIHKWEGPFWRREDLQDFIQTNGEKCVIVIDNFALDITSYLLEHPGGSSLLQKYSLSGGKTGLDASAAFNGELNNHSQAARRIIQEFRVAKILE